MISKNAFCGSADNIHFVNAYHADGQLASADYGDGRTEDFAWDGLALIERGDEKFINEPHAGNAPKKLCFEGKPRAERRARRARKGPRGNPVVSSTGTSYFNDILGTTVGTKSGRKYSAAALTAFGEGDNSNSFFTGKPYVEGLGYAFLMRNYRASLAKWQTADPIGYPDGWNQLIYGVNSPIAGVDILGAVWTTEDMYQYYLNGSGNALTLSQMNLKDAIWRVLCSDYDEGWENGGEWWRGFYLLYCEGKGNNPTGFIDRMKKQIKNIGIGRINTSIWVGESAFSHNFSNGYNFAPVAWALGGGSIYVANSNYTISWTYGGDGFVYYTIIGTYNLHYRDDFSEPIDVPGVEWGTPYAYYDSWLDKSIYITGRIAE